MKVKHDNKDVIPEGTYIFQNYYDAYLIYSKHLISNKILVGDHLVTTIYDINKRSYDHISKLEGNYFNSNNRFLYVYEPKEVKFDLRELNFEVEISSEQNMKLKGMSVIIGICDEGITCLHQIDYCTETHTLKFGAYFRNEDDAIKMRLLDLL